MDRMAPKIGKKFMNYTKMETRVSCGFGVNKVVYIYVKIL